MIDKTDSLVSAIRPRVNRNGGRMTYGTFEAGDFTPFDRPIRKRAGVFTGALCISALVSGSALGVLLMQSRPTPLGVAAAPRSRSASTTLPAAIGPLRRYAVQLYAEGTARAPAVAPGIPLRAAYAPLRPMARGLDTPLRLAQADDAPLPLPHSPVPHALAPKAVAAYAAAAPETAPTQAVASLDVEPQVVPSLPPSPPLVREIPMPAPRPSRLALAETAIPSRAAPAQTTVVASARPETPAPAAPAPAAPDQPSFFDKLFGGLARPGSALGYAPADGGLSPGAPDRYTAVYDIAAHTVTLPDGRRLEAHSGYGANVDDPRSVAQRMRGATPPNLYDLTPREAMFHGVRALRMTPLGGTTYGRAGLLTHSYMLRGREGESNGCVVFRDYQAFLAAYDAGMIRRLLVVANSRV